MSSNIKPKTKHKAAANDTGEQNADIDFDLRTAVIYSEILKPKFNE